jgi:hypothetical protein
MAVCLGLFAELMDGQVERNYRSSLTKFVLYLLEVLHSKMAHQIGMWVYGDCNLWRCRLRIRDLINCSDLGLSSIESSHGNFKASVGAIDWQIMVQQVRFKIEFYFED